MNTDQLQQLKTMVADAGDLPEAAKIKLLELLEQQPADAEPNPSEEGREAGGQLLTSVEELGAAHPEATGFMNRLATTLANMGI